VSACVDSPKSEISEDDRSGLVTDRTDDNQGQPNREDDIDDVNLVLVADLIELGEIFSHGGHLPESSGAGL